MDLTIQAVIFDKDGTLFDFRATWDVWAGDLIEELAEGDQDRAATIAAEIRYDLGKMAFSPDSPVIAGTNREAAEAVARAMPGHDVDEIEIFMERRAQSAPLREAAPLKAVLGELQGMGLRLGVVTNDAEASARAHLTTAGVTECFDFIAGFDTGVGMKPGPEPLWAFADAVQIAPEHIVMVGDSTHDLIAGRRAGMQTVGVLTGPAPRDVLAPLATVVLPDIGHLRGWLTNMPAERVARGHS